jgi:A/G-specific adenine glycosylase
MPDDHALLKNRTALQQALLSWYHANRRRLPWREKPSLYSTVVSEFMLQQTQIRTALPYFERWMRTLPDFKALAAAEEAEVLKLWEGLGYYSRARNLHRLAKTLISLPSIPTNPGGWQELPGIGPYTSAAITSIAFGTHAACVDGNVVRILARLSADDRRSRDSASAAKQFTPLARELLNTDSPGDHNQAMMELGATVCTKHKPSCVLCPVSAFCQGRKDGIAEELPRLEAKLIEKRSVQRLFCLGPRGLLLHKAPGTSKRLANILELPSAEQLGLNAEDFADKAPLISHKRSITRFQITESIHALPPPARLALENLVWVPVDTLPEITLSGPHKRWLGETPLVELLRKALSDKN